MGGISWPIFLQIAIYFEHMMISILSPQCLDVPSWRCTMFDHYFDICGPKPFENRAKMSGFRMCRPFEYWSLKSPVYRLLL